MWSFSGSVKKNLLHPCAKNLKKKKSFKRIMSLICLKKLKKKKKLKELSKEKG